MRVRRPAMKANNIRAALRGKRKITSKMTWERHPDGDELLHILDGEVEVTLLTDNGSVHVTVGAGSIFVVPRGVWHRQTPQPVATVLAALPTDHGPVSFADDPRKGSDSKRR